MPVYAYQCKNCHHSFDIRQSFSEDALTECPECHQPQLRKKFNTVGVVFKGSGFYSTDSHQSSGSGSAKDSGGGSSAATGGESSSAGQSSSAQTSTSSAD